MSLNEYQASLFVVLLKGAAILLALPRTVRIIMVIFASPALGKALPVQLWPTRGSAGQELGAADAKSPSPPAGMEGTVGGLCCAGFTVSGERCGSCRALALPQRCAGAGGCGAAQTPGLGHGVGVQELPALGQPRGALHGARSSLCWLPPPSLAGLGQLQGDPPCPLSPGRVAEQPLLSRPRHLHGAVGHSQVPPRRGGLSPAHAGSEPDVSSSRVKTRWPRPCPRAGGHAVAHTHDLSLCRLLSW